MTAYGLTPREVAVQKLAELKAQAAGPDGPLACWLESDDLVCPLFVHQGVCDTSFFWYDWLPNEGRRFFGFGEKTALRRLTAWFKEHPSRTGAAVRALREGIIR
jgi:hypothetical protein